MEQDQFGNKIGAHILQNGQKIKPGEFVLSGTDLKKKFMGKFEQVLNSRDAAVVNDTEPPILDPEVLAVNGGSKVAGANTAPISFDKLVRRHGIDVSDEFPGADKAEVFVFHSVKNNAYTVTDLNGNKLKRFRKDKSVFAFVKGKSG